jgi:DNA-binding LacI/PurR family transcriptional regulator
VSKTLLDTQTASRQDAAVSALKQPLKARATLKDVAREADVSLSTVSYVLNDSPHAERITSATRQRVREAADRLGYKSNPIGRALQRGYTNQLILLIVTWDLATSHSATAMAVCRAAIARGLELTVHVVDDDLQAETFLRRRMMHNIAGLLVLWDSPAMRASHLDQMASEGVPVVDLLPDSPTRISTVTPDRENAFFDGTKHLIDLGHRRIGMIADALTRPKTTFSKLAGYRRALESAGLPFDESLVIHITEFGFEGGLSGFPRLMDRDSGATAAICINDPIALGLIAAATDAGRHCPKDFSVVGFGDSPMGKHWRPALTTVALSARRVAEAAVSVVFQKRQNPALKPQRILVPEELIIRQSTGPPSNG